MTNVVGLAEKSLRTLALFIAICVMGEIHFNAPAEADYGEAISALHGTNGLAADFRRAERLLRACAWQDDDILCQIALGDLYRLGVYPAMATSFTRPAKDDSEALAWYFISLTNLESQDRGFRFGTHYMAFKRRIENGCRIAYELQHIGDGEREKIREDAKGRIKYIYRSRGASGWFQLGEAAKRRMRNPCGSLFGTDKHLARLHFEEARQKGHPFAADEIASIDRSRGYDQHTDLSGSYDHKLLYPPFTLKKEDNVDVGYSQLPARYLTDESQTLLESEPNLNLLGRKSAHARAWLTEVSLHEIYPKKPIRPITPNITAFRKDLNIREEKKLRHPLAPWEIVLALKLAANVGGTESANALGEMYFNGIGVSLNMERSRYAFEIAAFKDTVLTAIEDGDPKDDIEQPVSINQRHEGRSLDYVVRSIEFKKEGCPDATKTCIELTDINYNAVKNLCLILADDTRFPNHRTLAKKYYKILNEAREDELPKPGARKKQINDCGVKLGYDKVK